jgi:hypothetical protein
MNFLLAIIGHLVGDFLLQNDWMAKGKKRSHKICFLHAWIWVQCVGVFGSFICPLGMINPAQIFHGPKTFPTHAAASAFLILLATHFVQDRWNFIPWYMGRISGQKDFLEFCGPWSHIIVDQIWHILTILAVYKWILHDL